MIKKLVILFLVSMSSLQSGAQNLELGLFGGVSYYNGDLNPAIPFNNPEPVYGVLGRYAKGTRWAFRAAVTTGKLTYDGQYARVSQATDTSFSVYLSDFSLIAEFNFFDYFTGSQKDYATPYIFAGISGFGTGNSMGPSLGFNNLSFPFGFGVKYSVGKRLGIAAEWRMHKTFTDGLDSNAALPEGQTDINNNDWFNFTGITLTYKFNLEKRQACNSSSQSSFD